MCIFHSKIKGIRESRTRPAAGRRNELVELLRSRSCCRSLSHHQLNQSTAPARNSRRGLVSQFTSSQLNSGCPPVLGKRSQPVPSARPSSRRGTQTPRAVERVRRSKITDLALRLYSTELASSARTALDVGDAMQMRHDILSRNW